MKIKISGRVIVGVIVTVFKKKNLFPFKNATITPTITHPGIEILVKKIMFFESEGVIVRFYMRKHALYS